MTVVGGTTYDVGPIVIVTYTVWQTVHVHTAGGPVTVTTITVTRSETPDSTPFAVAVEFVEVEIGDGMEGGYNFGKEVLGGR